MRPGYHGPYPVMYGNFNTQTPMKTYYAESFDDEPRTPRRDGSNDAFYIPYNHDNY